MSSEFSDNAVWAIFWVLLATVALTITAAITFNIEQDRQSRERIITLLKINPLVYDCADKSLSLTSNYLLCSNLVNKIELTDEEKAYLLKQLENK